MNPNPSKTTFGLLLLAWALLSGFCHPDGVAWAGLTDEIQVYDAEINEVGEYSVELHNNFTAIGHHQPDFPGGLVPNHTLDGVPEWAVGVTPWFEAGLYFPVYSVTSAGHPLFDSTKLRALFVSPHAADRSFFYGVNFELSYNSPHWDPSRWAGEVRPIIGGRIGPWDFIFNPIFDTEFHGGLSSLDFVPCERIAYNLSKIWAVALEHYEDYGRLNDLASLDRQDQTLFAVVDYKGEVNQVEFGVGHSFTGGGESLVFKLMITHNFNSGHQ
jgi:hypothetical protein